MGFSSRSAINRIAKGGATLLPMAILFLLELGVVEFIDVVC